MKKYLEGSKDYLVCTDGFVYRNGNKLSGSSMGKQSKYKRLFVFFKDGSRERFFVHRLVAEAFIPNPENKPYVNHKNGIQDDNRVENLEWVTPRENSQHAIKTGLMPSGEDRWQAKLTEAQVHEICQLMVDGWRNKELSEKFKVHKWVMTSIRNGISWKDITSQYDYVKPRQQRMSDRTRTWILNKRQEGLTLDEILEASSNENVTKTNIEKVLGL